MQLYLLLITTIELVASIQYNQPCTFSSGTCDWSIGRRWHIMNLDDENKVLIADAESKEDKRIGFTDAIMSSWLHLSPLCSLDVRFTFRFSIQNPDDRLEVYLIQKNRTQMTSLGQWKGLSNKSNSSKSHELIWQKGNVTFKASEEFRIDMEIRHFPDATKNSVVWFGVDDILLENCLLGEAINSVWNVDTTMNTHYSTETTTTTPILWTTRYHFNESNSTLFNVSDGKLDNASSEQSSSPRQTLLTLLLYLFCALIALTLLIILFSIIIFTYRKHCCPSSLSTTDHRYQFGTNPHNNRVGIQIENIDRDYQTVKTIHTPVRPCFE